MTWPAAAASESALGGYLATLNTKAENSWLYDKFGENVGTSRDLWIGSKDKVTEGTWYWYNGTTSGDGGVSDNISSGAKWPDGTDKWHTNESNDWGSSGEDCGTIRGSLNLATWNDFHCTNNSLYGVFEID